MDNSTLQQAKLSPVCPATLTQVPIIQSHLCLPIHHPIVKNPQSTIHATHIMLIATHPMIAQGIPHPDQHTIQAGEAGPLADAVAVLQQEAVAWEDEPGPTIPDEALVIRANDIPE